MQLRELWSTHFLQTRRKNFKNESTTCNKWIKGGKQLLILEMGLALRIEIRVFPWQDAEWRDIKIKYLRDDI
jgi:hypothetical protein